MINQTLRPRTAVQMASASLVMRLAVFNEMDPLCAQLLILKIIHKQ